jgi:3-phosphoshikimate 1-carboxyvinyltransferase
MSALTVAPAPRLAGEFRAPGDKSISHRALILSALSDGPCRIVGLADGADVSRTRSALAMLGVPIRETEAGLLVEGVGLRGLQPPTRPIYCGNSGTTLRLLAGVLAGQPWPSELTGDGSLLGRPMGRVTIPLREMGAALEATELGAVERAPIRVHGCRPLTAIHHESPWASAQVKSAILLGGLYARGRTQVTEPHRSRDHTERMLSERGVPVVVDGTTVALDGPAERIERRDATVPGDPSSAAFLLGAAAMLPRSVVGVEGICLANSRRGFIDALAAMGADVTVDEEAGSVIVRGGAPLAGIEFGGAEVVRCLDELPLLAVVAARAEGRTVVRDAAELRVKESDRIANTCELLRLLGVEVEERPDGLAIQGDPDRPFDSFTYDAPGDHRMVMAAAVAALSASGDCILGPADAVMSSWPGFWRALEGLRCR